MVKIRITLLMDSHLYASTFQQLPTHIYVTSKFYMIIISDPYLLYLSHISESQQLLFQPKLGYNPTKHSHLSATQHHNLKTWYIWATQTCKKLKSFRQQIFGVAFSAAKCVILDIFIWSESLEFRANIKCTEDNQFYYDLNNLHSKGHLQKNAIKPSKKYLLNRS